MCSPKSVCGYTVSSSLGGKGFRSSLILFGAAQATGRTMITQSLFSSAIALRPKWFYRKLTAPAQWKFIWKAPGKILDPIFRCAKTHVCPNNMGTFILCVPAPQNDLDHFGIFRMKYRPVSSEWGSSRCLSTAPFEKSKFLHVPWALMRRACKLWHGESCQCVW